VIASAPVASIVVVAAKKARPGVVAEIVEMAAMDTTAACHATPVTAHATDVNAAEAATAHATDVAATAHAATMAAAEAATTHATAMTAAASTPAPAAHQHQRTTRCTQIGVVGIARLREGRCGGKSQRKSADETERDYVAFHDCIPLVDVSPPAELTWQLVLPTVRDKTEPCDILDWVYQLRLRDRCHATVPHIGRRISRLSKSERQRVVIVVEVFQVSASPIVQTCGWAPLGAGRSADRPGLALGALVQRDARHLQGAA
jgi:hypothetical protein